MIRAVIAYFRSGGTLLNKCLAAIPDTVVMSEVSPLKNQVARQARNWYGIELYSTDFVDCVRELNEVCERTSRHLILRLWVVGEFAAGRRDSPPPTYQLSGYHLLKGQLDEVRAVALMRDPIDIWISRGCRSAGFFQSYRRYVENVLSERIKVYRYEDLCRYPDATLRSMCDYLNLPFDRRFTDFHKWTAVRGDTKYDTSRGHGSKTIKVLKRRRISPQHKQMINESEDMIAVNRALGYPASYEGSERETLPAAVLRHLRAKVRRR